LRTLEDTDTRASGIVGNRWSFDRISLSTLSDATPSLLAGAVAPSPLVAVDIEPVCSRRRTMDCGESVEMRTDTPVVATRGNPIAQSTVYFHDQVFR
jgi:hypothetical protein